MSFHRATLWVVAGAVVALAAVSAFVEERLFRTFLALLAAMPLIYVALRVALGSEKRVAQQQRRFLKLRAVTDEFVMSVRTLNRLTVLSKTDPNPPEDIGRRIEELVQRMHGLVERMKEAAGEEEPEVGGADAGEERK